MNALDQAFIKAFAKDRTVTAEREEEASPRVGERVQPPDESVESTPLVPGMPAQQDQRWRLDRPITNQLTLDSHLQFPVVESLQADETKDGTGVVERFLHDENEGRSGDPIPELIRPVEFMETGRVPLAVDDESARETGTDVESREAPRAERDVPTLGIPADRSVAQWAGAVQPEKEEVSGATEERPAHPFPEVIWVAMELRTPELMTREFGGLEAADAWRFNAATSSVEVFEPEAGREVFPGRVDAGCLEEPEEKSESGGADACTDSQRGPETRLEPVEFGGECNVPRLDQPSVVASGGASESGVVKSDVKSDGNGDDKSDAGETPRGSREAETTSDAELDPPPSPSSGTFAPAWEVDAFRWPELCWQLDEQTGARLEQAGQELFAATRDGLNVLAVTSSSRSEGRTTAALALARSAMLAGASVALVDADFGNPDVSRRLGMEAPCDWCEVVGRGECLSEAAVTSLGQRITLFPKKLGEASEGNGGFDLLLNMLSHLSRCFDLVVVDLPPAFSEDTVLDKAAVQAVGETLTSCPIDLAVVVRNVRETPRDQCMATVSSVRGLGIQAVGVIENYTQPSDVAVYHRTRLAVQPSDSRCQE